MFGTPKTREEAIKTRYGAWAGFPRGAKFNPGRCAYEVFPNERGGLPHQCSRKPGHGPDGLYCAQHAKNIR